MQYFFFVRRIAKCFREPGGIPFPHRAGLQQQARVGGGRGIEGETIALNPKRNRSIERVDGAEGITRQEGTTEALGKLLFTSYVVPFEVVSVLLLVAMLGVILLSRKNLE